MNENRHIFIFFLAALAVIFHLSSCDPKEGPNPPTIQKAPFKLVLLFDLSAGNNQVILNQPFTDTKNLSAQYVAMQYYLSNIRIKNTSGAFEKLSEAVLINHRIKDPAVSSPQWENFITFELKEGAYESIFFDLGLPAALNESDPTTFANEHALSTYAGMYWNWATMYRFVILEAKMDTAGNSEFSHDLIFHTGTDELYRPDLSFNIDINAEPFKTDTLRFEIDWNDLFHNGIHEIEIKKEHLTHTTDSPEEFDLARRFTDNMAEAIQLK